MNKKEIEKWIGGDESASEMLSRVSSMRPFLFPPPLHRVPLRVGNVVELVGPSPSAKTHILIHAAITSVLPKCYGGLDHLVLFLDLDCRFDIARFSQLLIHRITQHGTDSYDKTLYALCMARFLYVRCYDSFEFLHTLRVNVFFSFHFCIYLCYTALVFLHYTSGTSLYYRVAGLVHVWFLGEKVILWQM